MLVKVVLVDVNPKMISAWRASFEGNPEVEIVHGSMLDQPVSAWVSPTNSAGRMDGGLDLVLKNFFGAGIEKTLQGSIKREYSGSLPVGHALCTPTEKMHPRYLISTPTMVGSSDDISASMNVALACAAAFQAVHRQNTDEPGAIRSVALPGLGAQTGRVPVEICADLMWTAYDLFRAHAFRDFAQMRMALQSVLGDLEPASSHKKSAAVALASIGVAASNPTLAGAKEDFDESELEDFDDSEDH
jgi:O-acetyl-ADP-ribose deacetylase (regulator of RNase III)